MSGSSTSAKDYQCALFCHHCSELSEHLLKFQKPMNFKGLPRQDPSFLTVAWEAWLGIRMHRWEAQGSTHDLSWGSNTMGSEHIVLREKRKVLTLIRCDGEQWPPLLIGRVFLLSVPGIHLPSPRIHDNGVTPWWRGGKWSPFQGIWSIRLH